MEMTYATNEGNRPLGTQRARCWSFKACPEGKTTAAQANTLCLGKICTVNDDVDTCCSIPTKCLGNNDGNTYAYMDKNNKAVQHINGKAACQDNQKFLETAMGNSAIECCKIRAKCSTMTHKTCINPMSFFKQKPQQFTFKPSAYCAGSTCWPETDLDGASKTCCTIGSAAAECSTAGAAFCDTTSHVLQQNNMCTGSVCTDNDKAVCCKEKAKCSTLNKCSTGREIDPTKKDTYCFGSMCNTIDDSLTCCKIKSTTATCGGTDQDINFAIQDNDGNDGYLRWGDEPCEYSKVFNKDANCASNICKRSDSTTCCSQRATCSSDDNICDTESNKYLVQDSENTYCSGAICTSADSKNCCEVYKNTTLLGNNKLGDCEAKKTWTENSNSIGTKDKPCQDCSQCSFSTHVMLQECTATKNRLCVQRCEAGEYYNSISKKCDTCTPPCGTGYKEITPCSEIIDRTCGDKIPEKKCDIRHTYSKGNLTGEEPCTPCTICEKPGQNQITVTECTATSDRTCAVKQPILPKDLLKLWPIQNPTGNIVDTKLKTEIPTPSVNGLYGCKYRNDGAINNGKARVRWDNPNVKNGLFRGVPINKQTKLETESWDTNCENYANGNYNICVNPLGSGFNSCSWYGPIPKKTPLQLNEEKKYLENKKDLLGCKTRDDGGRGVFRAGNPKASGVWQKKSSTEVWDKACESAKQSECPRWGEGGASQNAPYASGGTNNYSRCSWYCGPDTAQQNCPVDDNNAIYYQVEASRKQKDAEKEAKEKAKMKALGTSFDNGYRCTSLQGYPWNVRCRDGWRTPRANACHGCAIIPQNKIECEKVVPSICKWKKTL